MIKKKNNSYTLIKKNIAKLALIHKTTDISPNRLAALFLKSLSEEDLLLPKKTMDIGIGSWPTTQPINTSRKKWLSI